MSRAAAEARGRRAERRAAWWLRLHGWHIVGERLRVSAGEVDLVARRGRTLAFIEVKWRERAEDLDLAIDVAKQIRFHNIAISIDDLGPEWPSLMGRRTFPFVELKVDRQFVSGCADDRLKQTICRGIIDLADGYGARTVAEGIETRADFLAVHEMGFNSAQGFLFGRAMAARKFARSTLTRPILVPGYIMKSSR